MRICVVGTGYVGLVTGAVLADLGNTVIGVDRDEGKVGGLVRGVLPIYEPGLEEIVRRCADDGRLRFTTDLAAAVSESEVIFIAVGTPARADGGADLSAVEEVARGIAAAMDRYTVIVNKSTVPVGTGVRVREIVERHRRVPVDFEVVSNPEFLREGSAVEDTLRPDRIVVGASSARAALPLLELYAPLERPMLITSVASAELIKYASNAFLATKISFSNAIADLCELSGADVTQVTRGMGLDRRIGASFLQAGLGFGGACFPKDTRALIHTASDLGYEFGLMREVLEINRERTALLMEKITKVLAPLEERVIGVLGLAFKPDTDDVREAKSVELIHLLASAGARVRACDPVAAENARPLLPPSVRYCGSPYEAAEGADALVLVTEWREFRGLALDRVRRLLRRPLVFDGRNLYEPETMRRLGYEYYSIGRPAILP